MDFHPSMIFQMVTFVKLRNKIRTDRSTFGKRMNMFEKRLGVGGDRCLGLLLVLSLAACSHEPLPDSSAVGSRVVDGEEVAILKPKSGEFDQSYDGYGHFYGGRKEDDTYHYKPAKRSMSRDHEGNPYFRSPDVRRSASSAFGSEMAP